MMSSGGNQGRRRLSPLGKKRGQEDTQDFTMTIKTLLTLNCATFTAVFTFSLSSYCDYVVQDLRHASNRMPGSMFQYFVSCRVSR